MIGYEDKAIAGNKRATGLKPESLGVPISMNICIFIWDGIDSLGVKVSQAKIVGCSG